MFNCYLKKSATTDLPTIAVIELFLSSNTEKHQQKIKFKKFKTL